MTNCTCGAKLANHPKAGYSECGACIEALKAQAVKTPCDWPGCSKRIRKFNLGSNFCREHRRTDWDAFMGICHLEGPQGLSRGNPSIAERFEFWQTGKLPASRLVPVTFQTTKMSCAHCYGPLVMVNDPDWSPDHPTSMSCRYTEEGNAGSAKPWGIGICRNCSFSKQAA